MAENVRVVVGQIAGPHGVRGEVKIISAKGSKIPVVVIPTNEELMIAKDTVKVLSK